MRKKNILREFVKPVQLKLASMSVNGAIGHTPNLGKGTKRLKGGIMVGQQFKKRKRLERIKKNSRKQNWAR